MMLGAAYLNKAVRAVLGSSRSQLFPAVLWSGLLDPDGILIAMSGQSHPNTDATFGESGGIVVNVTALDLGVAGPGWTIGQVAFYDAPTGGQYVLGATLDTPYSPAVGDPLVVAVGDLQFTAY